ncbi:MAG: L,D-transpeptidase [Omnitrophica WOR_2 bacterium]
MREPISRRDFLKLASISVASLAFQVSAPDTPLGQYHPVSRTPMIGRVTRNGITIYSYPDLKSQRIRKVNRDVLLNLLEEIISPQGPDYNRRWYRLSDGFIHSAYVQRVEQCHSNPPVQTVFARGQPGEVTKPFAQTFYKNREGNWVPMYRIYYQSVHWITGVMEGMEGNPWYVLTDEWLRVNYCVPVEAIRLISPAELKPVSADIPEDQKRIEVNLKQQRLAVYEYNRVIFETEISSGIRYMETPEGDFHIMRKHPSKHMGDGGLTSDLRAYELVGVPWDSFFHPSGIAFHGTYWHDNFGYPMSHGCINMRPDDARWLFRWSLPSYNPNITDRSGWKTNGNGTHVRILS